MVFVAGCAPKAPQAELTAYLHSFDETYAVSNEVLDLVGAFERRTDLAVATEAADPDDDLEALLLPNETAAGAVSEAVRACEGRDRLGPDAFCFEMRHAFATVGDPPLTAAYRRTLSVIHRYNTLLVAYAEGRSGDVLAAELGALQSDIDLGLSLGGVALPEVGQAFAFLKPLASFGGAAGDRERFRAYLLENHPAVDQALAALMRGSEGLYDQIAQDVLNRSVEAGAAETAALGRQLALSRQALANLTYMFEDTRAMLAELVGAVENPDLLESRLRSLGLLSLEARVDAEAVRRDLIRLSTGAP